MLLCWRKQTVWGSIMLENIKVLRIISSLLKWIVNKIVKIIKEKAYNEGRLRTCFQYETENIVRLCDDFCLQEWDISLRTQKYAILIRLKQNISNFGNLKKKEHTELNQKIQIAIESIDKNKDVKDILEIKEMLVCFLDKFRRQWNDRYLDKKIDY